MKTSLLFRMLFVVMLLNRIEFAFEKVNLITNDSEIIREFEYSLKDNLLNTWYPKIIDPQNGGYHAQFDYKFEYKSSFPKNIIIQSRGFWVASDAALNFPDSSIFRQAADHGYRFLKDKMWDHQQGGFFEYDQRKNVPDFKTAYGNSFALFGLSAYYKMTQSSEVLELAKKTFQWIEKAAYDSINGGYFNWMSREGYSFNHLEKIKKNKIVIPEYIKINYKDYNTSIHILEAYTELYKVWPDSVLKSRLRELYHLILQRFVQDEGYLFLHFDEKWNHFSLKDSSSAFFKQNSYFDHVSFGHDMETAYLMIEAAHALNIEPALEKLKKMMDHAIENGFDEKFQGIFYEGYYFKGEDSITIINPMKDWWVQAEGLNSLLLFSQLYPHDPIYKEVFYQLWHYTKNYSIDTQYGSWYPHGIDQNREANLKADKAYAWKSCYHTYRALRNCLQMLKIKKVKF